MNLDTLFTIFLDALAHRLLPMMHETTLSAMRQFMPQDYPIYAIVAGAGALAASALLYSIGIWLRRMPKKISTEAQQARIEKLRVVAMEWLPWLLVLSPTPVGGILIIAAGFFAIRPAIAALAITVAEVLWRISPLL